MSTPRTTLDNAARHQHEREADDRDQGLHDRPALDRVRDRHPEELLHHPEPGVAISGPGCGGTRPCSTDRPASAGMPTSSHTGLRPSPRVAGPAPRSTVMPVEPPAIGGRATRRATVKMIGSSRTTPISKNSGMPTIIAITAIAHGTRCGPLRLSTVSAICAAPP